MKFAAKAASLLLVTSLLVRFATIIESPNALGEDLKQASDGHSMSYVEELTIEGKKEPIITRNFIAEDGRKRTEMVVNVKETVSERTPNLTEEDGQKLGKIGGNVTTIFDSTGQIRLILTDGMHTAIVSEAKENQGINAGKMFLNRLERLTGLRDKPDKQLGRRELDGKHVTGFVGTEEGRGIFTMWIANATGEPVRIEYDSIVNGKAAHTTLKDFQFHQTLDESLFSFEVPDGYEVFGRPKDGKFESPAGVELAWSQNGGWFGVASAIGRPTVFGLKGKGRIAELNAGGEEVAKFKVGEQAWSIRTATLVAGQEFQFLTFGLMQGAVQAHNSEGELLWSYPSESDGQIWGVNDIWPADLDGDGRDEVIIGYNGFTGLHVLDSKGQLLWKNTERGNIWHVAAGDVDGDGKPEVLSTCAQGKVQVFSAEGKYLRDIDPDFYANMVRTWQPAESPIRKTQAEHPTESPLRKGLAEKTLKSLVASHDKLKKRIREEQKQLSDMRRKDPEDEKTAPVADDLIEAELAVLAKHLVETTKAVDDMRAQIKALGLSATETHGADNPTCLMIVAGGGKENATLALLDSSEKTLWSLKLSAKVNKAATCAQRPWVAISLRDGNVRVVDLAAGKEIAHLGGQGGSADVAWLPVDGGAPLLVVQTHEALQAFRIAVE